MSDDVPHYKPMTEQRAREILGEQILSDATRQYFVWIDGVQAAALNGNFTADQLEAVAWWMRNKRE